MLVEGHRYAERLLPGHLPYGLRVVSITRPLQGSTGREPRLPPTMVALDAHVRAIRVQARTESAPEDVRWWKTPTAPLAGPCSIHTSGLPALRPQWGHVAAAIHSYPGRIVGRAFFSCIDTEYDLHNWPIDAAILLDAAHPAGTPAAIPGFTPVPGSPSVFNARGDGFHGEQTATRAGNAWLLVAGGSGVHQRIAVLHHLTVTVHA